jgi:uncharacterized protein YlxW (UPF0749 family)
MSTGLIKEKEGTLLNNDKNSLKLYKARKKRDRFLDLKIKELNDKYNKALKRIEKLEKLVNES